MTYPETDDRRVRKTRTAIFQAFTSLVLSRRYDAIKVSDIIAQADIGRSTFYDHFKSKDDVLLKSIEPLFDVLAKALLGRGDHSKVVFVLEHFWEQRAVARVIFGPDLFFKLAKKLAGMIAETATVNKIDLPASAPVDAFAIERASANLALIKSWLVGEFPCEAQNLAAYICEVQSVSMIIPND